MRWTPAQTVEEEKTFHLPSTIQSDIAIAQGCPTSHIKEIAARAGISNDDLEYYGKYKAKLPLKLIDENKISQSKLILVTAD